MASVGLGGGTISILLVLWRVFLWVNHKTVRSRCCGHTAEIGIDVDSPAGAANPPPLPNIQANTVELKNNPGTG